MTPLQSTDSRGAGGLSETGRVSVDAAAVFVLGMHRSGTSAVARIINLLGVPLSIRADWTPGNPQVNPSGFWESLALAQVNDDILTSLDGSWQVPPALEPGWPADPRLATLRETAPATIDEVFPTKQWVWKDPRNCLTLPFWLEVLEVAPAIVLVHRSPVEVALSLQRREALRVIHSLCLWERYVRASIDVATGLRTYVLDYARLLKDPVVATSEVCRFLTSAGFGVREPEEHVLRSFLSSELRHSNFPDPDAWSQFGVSPEQRALYEAIASAAGAHRAFSIGELSPETPATEVLFGTLRSEQEARRRLRETIHSLHEANEHIQADLANVHSELAAFREHAAALEHRVDALQRTKAFRLLTAPGRLRIRVRARIRRRVRADEDPGVC